MKIATMSIENVKTVSRCLYIDPLLCDNCRHLPGPKVLGLSRITKHYTKSTFSEEQFVLLCSTCALLCALFVFGLLVKCAAIGWFNPL